jgi:YfiH family protein
MADANIGDHSGSGIGQTGLQASWPAGPYRALTTTRNGGVSKGAYAGLNLAAHVGDVKEAVARNRRMLSDTLGCDQIQWLDQVHGTRCLHAGPGTTMAVPEADAAWTTEPNLALAVLTADCLPVAFARRDGAAIAVAHAGWRGLVAGVLASVLQALPGEPAEYLAWIGPGIGVDAYEVGEEVAEAVRGMDNIGPAVDVHLHPGLHPGEGRPGKYQLDLAGVAAMQLGQLGVDAVFGERICTFSDPRFYPYRRDGLTGRMATVVWLAE